MCTHLRLRHGETEDRGRRCSARAWHEHEHVHATAWHVAAIRHDTAHEHGHAHVHAHGHAYIPARRAQPRAGRVARRMVQIEQDILAKNNAYAARESPAPRRARHLRAEPGVQPRLRQDHAAVQDHRDAQGQAAGRGDRRRPADQPRCRTHPRHRRAGDPDQHRQGLPSRRPHGRPRPGTSSTWPRTRC